MNMVSVSLIVVSVYSIFKEFTVVFTVVPVGTTSLTLRGYVWVD